MEIRQRDDQRNGMTREMEVRQSDDQRNGI
jgi:hypothetical protein